MKLYLVCPLKKHLIGHPTTPMMSWTVGMAIMNGSKFLSDTCGRCLSSSNFYSRQFPSTLFIRACSKAGDIVSKTKCGKFNSFSGCQFLSMWVKVLTDEENRRIDGVFDVRTPDIDNGRVV